MIRGFAFEFRVRTSAILNLKTMDRRSLMRSVLKRSLHWRYRLFGMSRLFVIPNIKN